ncbi:DUF2970 domain-containing protein [Massilia glaciei]|nr:DUF2970 domain-containing protein [Massilia glaciei]
MRFIWCPLIDGRPKCAAHAGISTESDSAKNSSAEDHLLCCFRARLHLFFWLGTRDNDGTEARLKRKNMPTQPQAAPRRGAKRSFGATMVAIAWSFIGLRRKSDFERDAAGAMDPLYVVVAGLIGTALLIGALMLAVRIALA